jgi:hypothetical protein
MSTYSQIGSIWNKSLFNCQQENYQNDAKEVFGSGNEEDKICQTNKPRDPNR